MWNENCAACHGKDGKGKTMMGRKLQIKDMTDPKDQASFTDAKATKTIKEGITDNGKVKMKPYRRQIQRRRNQSPRGARSVVQSEIIRWFGSGHSRAENKPERQSNAGVCRLGFGILSRVQ